MAAYTFTIYTFSTMGDDEEGAEVRTLLGADQVNMVGEAVPPPPARAPSSAPAHVLVPS
jgi:hypothetical protein